MVSARSRKWGLNIRRAFDTKDEALDYAREIEAQVQKTGSQPSAPPDVLKSSKAYEKLIERLRPFDKTPEEAVDHYIKFLGQQMVNAVKPTISDLTDRWMTYKRSDTTLNRRTLTEAESYSRFIKRIWGSQRPDDVKKNDIDVTLKGLDVSNNTRKKHLLFVRMFFKWVKDEGFIDVNPTDGIKFKPDAFEAAFYSPEDTKRLLKYVMENQPDLVGYYSILTFAGLRPTEGARVQWEDINLTTQELYVRKGKTQARHIRLEPVMVEWIKWVKDRYHDKPFVEQRNLGNRERLVRESMPEWIQDGLRHGFGTYFRNLKKDINLTAEIMGNSPQMVKKHYARTVEADKVTEFWKISPSTISQD